MTRPTELPPRYEPVATLGKGGGGEVWSVRDRITGRTLALKLLAEGSSATEVDALVREATALSGLEGLGVPKVLRFGRLGAGGRAYMVRELVEGRSLTEVLGEPGQVRVALGAIGAVAELLTRLHRARLLHGDVKPANIIVGVDGRATLVDLGLAATFHEGGARPHGLTPRYAAPELFEGGGLTVRAEVHALGATLRDVLEAQGSELSDGERSALEEVVARALEPRPEARYPSVDELANALYRAVELAEPSALPAAWPILGLDVAARDLAARVRDLPRGGGLVIVGPQGSGRSTLLRRLAWSLGVEGRPTAWLEPLARESDGALPDTADLQHALDVELGPEPATDALVLLVDDAERLDAELVARLGRLRAAGARLVLVAAEAAAVEGPTMALYAMQPLSEELGRELVLRAVPSLGESVASHVVERSGGWPGAMRAIVERIAGAPVVSAADVERILEQDARGDAGGDASDVAIRRTLERGHFEEAAELLARRATERSLELAVLRARLHTNRGETSRSLEELLGVTDELGGAEPELRAEYFVEVARAELRGGDYGACERASALAAEEIDEALLERSPSARPRLAEALAVGGLAKSYEGRHDEAVTSLLRSVEMAREAGDARILSVALGSLGFAQQRAGKLEEAKSAYEEALAAAESAGDAGSVATTRLNLAGIAKKGGDLASAIVHLEAAVDMGQRSGRRATLRQALLNLANLDLYLGRSARALVSIEKLAAERALLPPQLAAQLLSLEGEAASKSGDHARAEALCEACAEAYEALGRPIDAAEARLEALVAALEGGAADAAALRQRLAAATQLLGDSSAHRALASYLRGRVAFLAGDALEARSELDLAIAHAEGDGQREWLAEAHRMRALVLADDGQRLAARRDRETAVAIFEEIAGRLPRDLREVYWDEPRRRRLRTEVEAQGMVSTSVPQGSGGATVLSQDRLARVLEINRELAGTYDLKRLLERVTDHAIALSTAERGFVLLKRHGRSGSDGEPSERVSAGESEGVDLSIHASRGELGEDPHARFSRSIAERVVRLGEPIATTSAREDARMADYVSVHQLMLQSVACVPIRSRTEGVIGALYLETRLRPAGSFAQDLPLLVALADQVAIAIETARLVGENERRARELESANEELRAARAKLEELLGHRTAQLAATRRDLRSARAVIKGHFGYEGLVGTSEAMRRVYALVDRVKDTDVPVLITGESGTGKEIIARAIHNASARAKAPFVGINCGAIPENLLESELFGHVRGAFTGADRDRKGLFREAGGGSILLDEIGEMPLKMQAGLLRVLQEKLVRPVGGAREEPVDTRVIAATHRDLSSMVEAGRFREDLFYRLHVIQVRVPSLRERLDDIPVLIDHFLGIFAARYGRERRSVSRAALKRLMSYGWPGNVRQLENALLNAWVLSDAAELEPEDFELPDSLAVPSSRPSGLAGPAARVTSLDEKRADERERMLRALAECNWNRVKAAELIDMPRRTFYRRLREYGIQ